jgi:hypothetical protein
MFGPKAPFLVVMLVCAFLLLHALSYFTGRLHERMDGMRVGVLTGVYASFAVVFFFFWPSTSGTFIYFQF